MAAGDLLRLYVHLLLLTALMVVVAVVGGHGGTSGTGQSFPPSLSVDRIAYVSLQERIRTVRADGTDNVLVSPEEGFFSWPTWSPDGLRLAFSGVDRAEPGLEQSVLYELNTFSGRLRHLHRSEPGDLGLVAEGAPHYPYWSPDSSRLAFIGGSSSRGLTLYVDDIRDRAGPRHTLDRGPLWLDWSPDSKFLLVHRGLDHLLVDTEQDVTTDLQLDSDEFGYNVPGWKPTGGGATYVAGAISEGYGLYSGDLQGGEPTLIDQVEQQTAFRWSPDGTLLAVTGVAPAVANYGGRPLRVYPVVRLYTAEGERLPVEVHDAVVAFLWAPDSTKLAYVTVAAGGAFRWNILDVADEKQWNLVDFHPSIDQLVMFQYFEQYASSHSLWSPDSQWLVFAGRVEGRAVTASLRRQAVDRIIVLATHRNPSFQPIADGFLGFWSPR